jgi:hypothetical protein
MNRFLYHSQDRSFFTLTIKGGGSEPTLAPAVGGNFVVGIHPSASAPQHARMVSIKSVSVCQLEIKTYSATAIVEVINSSNIITHQIPFLFHDY